MSAVSFHLECVRCGTKTDAEPGVFLCPKCGGNTTVEYDFEMLKALWPREALEADDDLSIWRYAPLYPVKGRIDDPDLGWTPLFQVPRLGETLGLQDLWIKDDGRNPSASFKDRASAIALIHAKELGFDMVTGASTGNAASSTATLAAAIGMKTRIFLPKAAPQAKIAQLLAFGAEVLAVDGTYDQAFDLCLEASKRYGWYNRNTGYNPYTREGKKSVSMEICEQLDFEVPDVVVVPVGDGNIISGVWKGFLDFHRMGFIDKLPRLIAAQAEGSDAIARAVEGDGVIRPVGGETVADSISVSLPRDGDAAVKAIRESKGAAVRATDEAILQAIPTIARNSGVFAEPAAATGYAGLQVAVEQGLVKADEHVVLLITGNGLKDVASAMKATGQPRVIAPELSVLDELFGE